ncbi:hypothetical protein [Deinococcus sp.]|uniref:hypothetical protein n=1 Tax=Deinococcus sp. TaxID=47478 RepID=UPI003B5B8515
MLRPALLRTLALIALGLALIAFLIGAWWGRGAQTIQLLRPSPAAQADLFGDAAADEPAGTKIGSPQVLIVRDQSAFLPGEGANGLRYVSETKLTELGLYPLQLKTVNFFRYATVIGFVLLAALLWLLSTWSARRLQRTL